MDGTSFAAPIVAGVGAWVAAERPNLTVDQLANVVKLSAIDLDEDGWDANTGYGLVQVGNALRVRAPRNDPHEPNEDIFWVNGDIFRHPDPRIYDGHPRRGRVRARVDQFEDPADVYRVRFPGHSRTRITRQPELRRHRRRGLPRKRGQHRGAPSRARRSAPAERTERLVIREPGAAPRAGSSRSTSTPSARGLDAAYALKFKRIR